MMQCIHEKNISHAAALNLINNAVLVATEMSIAISACVVDRNGRVKAKLTMDGASLIADELVEKKAKTALLGLPSEAFAQAVKDLPEVAHSMLQLEPMTLLGGGLPIIVDNELVGAFAVGGATVEQDIACAEAAISKEGVP